MTFEECLEFCTKRMCVMGYTPNEIEAAAKKMFAKDDQILVIYNKVKILLDKPS